MNKILLVVLLLFQASGLWAVDLLDLRLFPLFDSQSVAFEGVVSKSSHKEEGTGLRAKFSGLRSKWLSSGTVAIESDSQKTTADIKDGEFSGVIRVSSLASFTISIIHQEMMLYRETGSFPLNADGVIVSDIDDTILLTEVTSRLKMAYNSMLKDVDEREPVNGTPELYREIGSGSTVLGRPHFIYLSSSPAFLSRSLKAFLRRNNFPYGTLILKKSLTSGDHEGHKSGWLKKVLDRYADKPLLLFGDSGEKDPFIYRNFVENNVSNELPRLVKGIIIHEITGSDDTIKSMQEFRDAINKKVGVPFIYWSKIDDLKQKMRDDGLLK